MVAPSSASLPPWERTLNCFSARSYWPAKHSSSKRKVLCETSPGLSRSQEIKAAMASETRPAANQSFALVIDLFTTCRADLRRQKILKTKKPAAAPEDGARDRCPCCAAGFF